MERICIASLAHGPTIFSSFKNICENKLENVERKRVGLLFFVPLKILNYKTINVSVKCGGNLAFIIGELCLLSVPRC